MNIYWGDIHNPELTTSVRLNNRIFKLNQHQLRRNWRIHVHSRNSRCKKTGRLIAHHTEAKVMSSDFQIKSAPIAPAIGAFACIRVIRGVKKRGV